MLLTRWQIDVIMRASSSLKLDLMAATVLAGVFFVCFLRSSVVTMETEPASSCGFAHSDRSDKPSRPRQGLSAQRQPAGLQIRPSLLTFTLLRPQQSGLNRLWGGGGVKRCFNFARWHPLAAIRIPSSTEIRP